MYFETPFRESITMVLSLSQVWGVLLKHPIIIKYMTKKIWEKYLKIGIEEHLKSLNKTMNKDLGNTIDWVILGGAFIFILLFLVYLYGR